MLFKSQTKNSQANELKKNRFLQFGFKKANMATRGTEVCSFHTIISLHFHMRFLPVGNLQIDLNENFHYEIKLAISASSQQQEKKSKQFRIQADLVNAL